MKTLSGGKAMILCPISGNWCDDYKLTGKDLACDCTYHKNLVCRSCGRQITGEIYPGGVCFSCFRAVDP